jgi:tryptophan 7-halogenase
MLGEPAEMELQSEKGWGRPARRPLFPINEYEGVSIDRVRNIVIVGGGVAGWLAAATLARLLKPTFCSVSLIESPLATDGAFSAVALPSFHRLNSLLGINESDLLRRTCGAFSLGAQFADWGCVGDRYFHTFGSIGTKLDAVPFHHYWLKLRPWNDSGIEDYSTASVAARQGRFAPPTSERTSFLSSYSYGYHFHAGLLAAYLREYGVAHGVTRIEGQVVEAHVRAPDGFIDSLQLSDGMRISADLYIDCEGPRGLLLQRVLNSRYEDWSHWLPCDRAVSALSAGTRELAPHSQAVAQRSGWSWRIPLQHYVDSGQVYSSHFTSDDAATAMLLADLPATVLEEPRILQWSPGRPAKFWDRNCVSLASCGLDPLESTGLHLVQTGVTRLVTLFPVSLFSPDDIDEYNRLTTMECERIRDFLILHYKATTRDDSPFWEHCRHMQVPDTLSAKIELFRSCGRLAMFDEEHFGEDSWLAVLLGQGVNARDYDPLADILDIEEAREALLRMRSMIREGVSTMPTLSQFIERYCLSKTALSTAPHGGMSL